MQLRALGDGETIGEFGTGRLVRDWFGLLEEGDAMLRNRRLAVGLVVAGFGLAAPGAWASLTPGWECIPTTAGQAVVSGGTGFVPSCAAGTTAVLAPTFVSSGVGGKPTVVFQAENLQVVSGSGSTSGTVNGLGNLIVGYAENPSGRPQTGSNNLILGSNNGWTGYGELVGGSSNMAKGAYAAVFGISDTASGVGSLAAGTSNRATGLASSAIGGKGNTASGQWSSILGGSGHHATGSCRSIPATNSC